MNYPTLGNRNLTEAWEFVRVNLYESPYDSFGGGNVPKYPFRSRFMHTMRVLQWAKRLLPDFPEVNQEAAALGIIFHDVGYSKGKNKEHPQAGAQLYLEFLTTHPELSGIFGEKEGQDYIAWIIAHHTEKWRLGTEDATPELSILMEADMMDEEGAMRVAWDNMAAAVCGAESFRESLERTEKYWKKEFDPMVTPLAKQYWKQKQEFVEAYISNMRMDLFLD
ncbi:MAG: HD domain-containing protein [Lachnospiraceae bacterium]|nr:HD domain-containing protein [Lachnospiraceae bacterium]